MEALRTSEQLLVEYLDRGTLPASGVDRVLCASLGRAQFAVQAAQRFQARCDCLFLDAYRAAAATAFCRQSGVEPAPRIVCASDPPKVDYDLAVLPTQSRGDAELTRDLMQQFYRGLREGGQLWVAVDRADDQWTRESLSKINSKIKRFTSPTGCVYVAEKMGRPWRERNFDTTFVIRHREHLLKLKSRPGVFSHRRLDTGARALIETVETEPNDRIIDVGCGCGGVGIALAKAGISHHLCLVDVNPRALECSEWGCRENGLTRFEAHLTDHVIIPEAGSYDVAVTNPPYYSDHRIAAIMVDGCLRALRPGGRAWIVSKHPEWYHDYFDRLGIEASTRAVRKYFVTVVRNA